MEQFSSEFPDHPERQKRERSRNHPGVSEEKGIEFLQEIRRRMGFKPTTRNALATGFNVSVNSGAFSTKIAALAQFGLVESTSATISITDLGKRVLNPISQADKKTAIAEAFRTPDLYQDLLRDFGGSEIPEELANRLFHEYGITETAKDNCARCFIESAQFAGFLGEDRILRVQDIELPAQHSGSLISTSSTQITDAHVIDENRNADRDTYDTATPNTNVITLPVTKGKKVRLVLPDELTDADITILKAQLDVISLQIKLNADLTKQQDG